MSIITNVHYTFNINLKIMKLICFISLIYIITFLFLKLDFQLADIKHSSLRTMDKHVRRAMLPENDEVFKRSFAEGNATAPLPPSPLIADAASRCCCRARWKAGS